ncbi:MAG: hypothetical protein WBB01_00910 [Phormidesmis sp.]
MNSEAHSTRTSPVLTDFKAEIFQRINDIHVVCAILEKIQKWAGGQLFLTELLCHYFIESSSTLTAGKEADIIDSIARQKILHDWENNAAGPHLKEIRKAILVDAEMRDSILILYMQILQRGTVSANSSPEQAVLLRSGLVTLNNGKLEVTNATYASVFSLRWVEQQLPGITRPVAIVSAKPGYSRYSPATLRMIALAGCMAILAAAVLMYLRGSQKNAITTSNAISPEVAASPEGSLLKSNRELFDQGMDHAENGRWLPMFREFCQLPTTSTYFIPAERQLGRWLKLYEEDLQIARNTFFDEGGGSCGVAEEVLGSPRR